MTPRQSDAALLLAGSLIALAGVVGILVIDDDGPEPRQPVVTPPATHCVATSSRTPDGGVVTVPRQCNEVDPEGAA